MHKLDYLIYSIFSNIIITKSKCRFKGITKDLLAKFNCITLESIAIQLIIKKHVSTKLNTELD